MENEPEPGPEPEPISVSLTLTRDMNAIIRNAIREKPNSVDEQFAQAMPRIRALEGFVVLQNTLSEKAVRAGIYQARHQRNVRIARRSGKYDIAPKVIPGGGESSKEAHREVVEEVYFYSLCGRVLGTMMRSEIPGFKAEIEAVVRGHTSNIKLLDMMYTAGNKLKTDKPVREYITAKRLREMIRESKAVLDGDVA